MKTDAIARARREALEEAARYIDVSFMDTGKQFAAAIRALAVQAAPQPERTGAWRACNNDLRVWLECDSSDGYPMRVDGKRSEHEQRRQFAERVAAVLNAAQLQSQPEPQAHPAAVPEGYVLMPVEPPMEIISAMACSEAPDDEEGKLPPLIDLLDFSGANRAVMVITAAYRAMIAAAPAQLQPPKREPWISVSERVPEEDTECLVFTRTGDVFLDTWRMQREAPVSWSSATIETGLGWDGHFFEEVTHWSPLPPPPDGITQQGGDDGN